MKLGGGSTSARPAPIDRNALNKIGQFETGATAPHAQTTRWTYTVPAGKKAVAQGGAMSCRRVTAAAPVGMVTVTTVYTPVSTGVAATESIIQLGTNNVLDHAESNLNPTGDMLAGDIESATTQDEGTGGTVSYKVNRKIFEYDA